MEIEMTSGTTASEESAEFREFIVKRDGNRPLAFTGKLLARATSTPFMGYPYVEAKIYQTRAARFVASVSRANPYLWQFEAFLPDNSPARSMVGGDRAAVFATVDEALGWVAPSALAEALRDNLGLNDPERVD
jgi:hypothetical protein